MRHVECAACQAKVPMNDAFSVADRTLCEPCITEFLKSRGEASGKQDDITRHSDPTVCVHCSADGGDAHHPTLANLPTCAKCESFFRNRPYPKWLKVSAAVFLCVAVAAFVYNLRFFLAYVELIRGERAMDEGNIPVAVSLYESASQRLPEIPELAVVPNLVNAQTLLTENKDAEALELVEKSEPYAPPSMTEAFRVTRLKAESGLAFDKHDYDTFLDRAKKLAEIYPDEAHAAGQVASAYACKFATTGDNEFKAMAMEHLEKAKSIVGDGKEEFAEYENRIMHRLETREIISGEEFKKRFPNGWKKEGGA